MNRILSIEKIDRFGRVVETIAESGSEHSEGAALMEPSLPDSTSDTGRSRRRGGALRVRVTPEEGEAFVISGRRASGMGLKPGDELTEEAYAEIIQSLRSACMQRCGTLLGSRDYPVHRLRTKLQEAGYPTSIIEDCIEKLQKAHYLDDARYAQTYLRSHLADRSLLRIRHDLMERGAQFMNEIVLAKIAPQGRINVVVSHDQMLYPLTIFATNRVLEMKHHEDKSWLNFLAGVAVIIKADGTVKYVPVKGLDEGTMSS